MITRAIDSNNDWKFGNGKQNYRDERSALRQNIQTRLLEFKNDCFFNLDAGIDWFSLLGTNSKDAIRNAVALVIIQTIGVKRIDSLELSVDSERKLSISYTITDIWENQTIDSVTVG